MSDGWRDDFNGTTMVYRLSPGEDIDSSQCDYDVAMQCESRPKDVRAIREELRDKGQKRAKPRFTELHNELLITLGPGMSANDAVSEMERLIKHFKRYGMCCGRNSAEEYVIETVGKNSRRFCE